MLIWFKEKLKKTFEVGITGCPTSFVEEFKSIDLLRLNEIVFLFFIQLTENWLEGFMPNTPTTLYGFSF